jgi:copper chaperone NosL
MTVSDGRFAAQVVSPGEEPLFFDDIGCLEAYLTRTARLPGGAVAYVADHRTRSWVLASAAVFTRVDDLETPMNSHLIAHADASSRDADPAATGGRAASLAGWPRLPASSGRGPRQ